MAIECVTWSLALHICSFWMLTRAKHLVCIPCKVSFVKMLVLREPTFISLISGTFFTYPGTTCKTRQAKANEFSFLQKRGSERNAAIVTFLFPLKLKCLVCVIEGFLSCLVTGIFAVGTYYEFSDAFDHLCNLLCWFFMEHLYVFTD